MATWTQLENIGSISVDGNFADYDDDDNIYFIKSVSSESHVYRYTVSTDTLTQISNSASFGSGPIIIGARPFGPVFFNGSVFVTVQDTGVFKVFKYDGSGTAWTEVLSVNVTATSGGSASLGKTDAHIILLVNNTQPNPLDVDYIVKYSANGSSWSDGTVDAGPSIPSATYIATGTTIYNPNGTVTGLYAFDSLIDAATPNHFVKRILVWDGVSEWTTAFYYTYDNPTYDGDSWVEEYHFNDVVHWSIPADYVYSDTLDGTFAAPTPDDVSPALTNGFTVSAGSKDDLSGDLALHYMATDTWDAGETIDAATTLGFVKRVLRFTATGDTYLIISGGVSQPTYIYGRDEPLDPPEPTEVLEFWQGVNGPGAAKKSDLPFTGIVNPVCMLVRRSGDVVIGGSAAGTGSEIVVTGTSADDFATWTDITGSLATDDPIRGLTEV